MPKTSFTLFSLIKVGKLRPGVFEAKEGEESKEEKQVLLKKRFFLRNQIITCVQEMRVGKVKSVFTKTEEEKVCWLVGHSKKIRKNEQNWMKRKRI